MSSSNAFVIVEVCVASLEGAIAAERAGADRIELNYGLELDGLTPGAGLLELVSHKISVPIIAMARPRGGNFVYSNTEWQTLVRDAQWLLAHGADGVAFGCLDSSGAVELERCREMRALAGGRELVFHKAFDEVRDWKTGLETLIEAGVNRVMTSGQKPAAIQGAATIAEMVDRAAGRIEILPAGRINAENAGEIVDLTQARQLHGSFSSGSDGSVVDEIRRTIDALKSRAV
jgi:copper homeostasis protein